MKTVFGNNDMVTVVMTNPAMVPLIHFGYRLWLPSNEEISMRYWEKQ